MQLGIIMMCPQFGFVHPNLAPKYTIFVKIIVNIIFQYLPLSGFI